MDLRGRRVGSGMRLDEFSAFAASFGWDNVISLKSSQAAVEQTAPYAVFQTV